MIIDELIQKIIKMDNPSVVGLDPRLSFIPSFIKEKNYQQYGKTLEGAAYSFLEFNKGIIDAIYDIVPAVKPQIGMYEQWGSWGMEVYQKTIAYAKEKKMIVIGDIKRGDISSTAQGYSHAHIGRVKLDEEEKIVFDQDFITVNPYMGSDSITPYLEDCQKYNRGLFVLVRTSNKGSGEIQNLDLVKGKKLYEEIGSYVCQWGKGLIGSYGYSSIGAVVGATHPTESRQLRKQMPSVFFLVPGYGAQGGKAEDIKLCFDQNGLGAIVNSSRGILTHYQNDIKYQEKNYADAARDAVYIMQKDLKQVLS